MAEDSVAGNGARSHVSAARDLDLIRAAIDPENVLNQARYPSEEMIGAVYRVKLAINGEAPEAVAWKNSEDQIARFRVFHEELPLEGASILDAGCGLGDFHRFLTAMGVRHTYHGIDAQPEFVMLARARYPDATFSCMDLKGLRAERSYDVVVASGLFFLHSPSFRRRLLPILFQASRVAFAFNLLSTVGEAEVPMRFRVSPDRALKQSVGLSPLVRMRHDYLPNDMTIVIWR